MLAFHVPSLANVTVTFASPCVLDASTCHAVPCCAYGSWDGRRPSLCLAMSSSRGPMEQGGVVTTSACRSCRLSSLAEKWRAGQVDHARGPPARRASGTPEVNDDRAPSRRPRGS